MNNKTNSKKRGCNFTPSEKQTLLYIVNKYIYILGNKCTKSEIIRKKREAWQEVAQKYNSVATSGHRTWMQLRHAYENFKQKSKKNIASDNKRQYCINQLRAKAAEDKVTPHCDEYILDVEPICSIDEIEMDSSCSEQMDVIKMEPTYFTQTDVIEMELTRSTQTDVIIMEPTYPTQTDVIQMEPNCSKLTGNNERANLKRQNTDTKKKCFSTKQLYFKTKLENARLEQKYFIQRERREKLQIHLLKLKIQRFVSQNKNKLVQ